jgi:hypothetical protein
MDYGLQKKNMTHTESMLFRAYFAVCMKCSRRYFFVFLYIALNHFQHTALKNAMLVYNQPILPSLSSRCFDPRKNQGCRDRFCSLVVHTDCSQLPFNGDPKKEKKIKDMTADGWCEKRGGCGHGRRVWCPEAGHI